MAGVLKDIKWLINYMLSIIKQIANQTKQYQTKTFKFIDNLS